MFLRDESEHIFIYINIYIKITKAIIIYGKLIRRKKNQLQCEWTYSNADISI